MQNDMELMAAIGRMVVNAAELEYAVAELAAIAEGLRGEECRERATAIVRRTGEAMRQFERLALIHQLEALGYKVTLEPAA